jgi:hypothetical protein
MKTLWIMTLVAMGALVSQAQAGHHHCGCPSCGCSNVKKVCRLVQETKKTTTFCYDSICEDFCLPGPSPCCGKKCVPNTCCGIGTGFHKEHIFGKPCSCGHIRTRKTLVKIPVTKETKVWVCKVDRVCCGCGCAQNDAKATAQAQALNIAPASAEQEIVLDEHSSFEENVAVVPATATEQVNAPEAQLVQQTSAIEEPAADESHPKSFLERLLSK